MLKCRPGVQIEGQKHLRSNEQTSVVTFTYLPVLLVCVCLCFRYLNWHQSAMFFPFLLFFFPICWCIHLFSESMAGRDRFVLSFTAVSVLCFFCTVLFSRSPSLPIVDRCSPPSSPFLPHPPALSLLFCSLCAGFVSRALTCRCDPTEQR